MANELKLIAGLSMSKNKALVNRHYSLGISISGDSFVHGTQAIGTTEEQLAQIADLGDPGYVLLKNLDDTNYIEIGATTGVYSIRLRSGEIALYRHNSATIYVKANTAECLLEYIIIED